MGSKKQLASLQQKIYSHIGHIYEISFLSPPICPHMYENKILKIDHAESLLLAFNRYTNSYMLRRLICHLYLFRKARLRVSYFNFDCNYVMIAFKGRFYLSHSIKSCARCVKKLNIINENQNTIRLFITLQVCGRCL